MKRLIFMALALLPLAFVQIFPTNPTKVSSVIVQANNLEMAITAVQAYGGHVDKPLSIIHAVSAKVPSSNIAALQTDPRVQHVYPDDSVRMASTPQPANPATDAPESDFPEVVGANIAWENGITGEDVTVAVVDTGIAPFDWNANRILARYDAVEDGVLQRDPNGHGTIIASLIGNNREDSNGFMGVAPDANLVDVRVLGANGNGTYADILEGLDWILANKDTYHIRIVNLSIIGGVTGPYWDNPLNQAVEELWANGLVVVAAAGNGGPAPLTISVPGNDPFVITVGAFTDNFTPNDPNDDYVTEFSGAGPSETGFIKPDVILPGAHLTAVLRHKTTFGINHPDSRIRGQYYQVAGTSSATAVASGVVALMIQANPGMTPDEAKYALMATAQPATYADGSLVWSPFQQGAGRVWAPDAVLNPPLGLANNNMTPGEQYVGPVIYRDGAFRIVDADGNDIIDASGYLWTGGYVWAGGYLWTGGYVWAGSYLWSGGYVWAGSSDLAQPTEPGVWQSGYSWVSESTPWPDGYLWTGGYVWAGSYIWSGGYLWTGLTDIAY